MISLKNCLAALPTWQRGIIAVFAVFLAIAIISWPHRQEPFYWDAVGYVLPHSQWIYSHNLSPILLDYDVGHPTAYFWMLAAMFKLVGVGPFAGHLLSWFFASLLVVGTYGLAKASGVPGKIAMVGGGLALLHPLAWSQSQQIQPDLPLAALSVAALWAWATKRWTLYILFASLAVLSKFHGMLLLAGPVAACFIISGMRMYHRDSVNKKEFFLTLVPLGILILFFVVRQSIRYAVIGQDWRQMEINYEAVQNFVPFWTPEFWTELPTSINHIIFRPALHLILFPSVLGILAFAGASFFGSRGFKSRDFNEINLRAWVAAFFFILGSYGALLQLSPILSRYALPAAAAAIPLGLSSWWFVSKAWKPIFITSAVLMLLFAHLWKLDRAEKFPFALGDLIVPVKMDAHYHMEIDLSYRNALVLFEGAKQAILEDRNLSPEENPPTVASEWPLTALWAEPATGAIEHPFQTIEISHWEEVTPEVTDYVVTIEMGGFSLQPKPPSNFSNPLEKIFQEREETFTIRVYKLR